MKNATQLQDKMGGPACALDRTTLILEAQRGLDAVTPAIEAALQDRRITLRAAAKSAPLDTSIVFGIAHQIRGLAGTVGRQSVGALADMLGTYLTYCADSGAPPVDEVVVVLVRALDQAFQLRDGDPVLNETLSAASQLTHSHSNSRIIRAPPTAALIAQSSS